jgi:hypothetical protein
MKQFSALLTLILAVAFAVSPLLTSPFSGFRADQLPVPQIDPPIQPAGYAFAIWGLIYAWLVISAAYGFLKRRDADDWTRARTPLMVSLAIGVPWLAIANASAIWATITIILMAVFAVWSLIIAPTRDRWLFQAPVAIYAGWLTAATWVSIGTTMAGYGVVFNAFGWAVAGIIGALIAALVVFRSRTVAPEFLFTVIWALAGIMVSNGVSGLIVSTLAAGGILVLLAAMTMWVSDDVQP